MWKLDCHGATPSGVYSDFKHFSAVLVSWSGKSTQLLFHVIQLRENIPILGDCWKIFLHLIFELERARLISTALEAMRNEHKDISTAPCANIGVFAHLRWSKGNFVVLIYFFWQPQKRKQFQSHGPLYLINFVSIKRSRDHCAHFFDQVFKTLKPHFTGHY